MDMKKKSLCCLALFLFAGAYAAAQERDLQDISDLPQNVSTDDITTPQKQEPKKKVQPKAEEPKQKNDGGVQSLLPITEGNFKYSRIPEITLPKTPAGDISHVPEELKKEAAHAEKDKKTSFFSGIRNDLIKVLVLLLIMAVFIFYRVNSGKRRNRKYFKI